MFFCTASAAAMASSTPAPASHARAAAMTWLNQHGGDPYLVSAVDADGRVGIDFGVYGVPETFLIDKNGVIRYKHIGPVTAEALKEKILPMAEELARG